MNKSLFALVIGAAAFIAQMPSKSLAAPVDDPEFLSVDVTDVMEDGFTTPSVAELTILDIEEMNCGNCPIRTTRHPTRPTHPTKKTKPTTKPTRPTKKTKPTTRPTHPTKKTKPTTKPTHPTKKTKPTTKPTHPTKKTKPTTKPTHPTKKTKPTTKPTHPTKKTKPTTRKPCHIVCHHHPCPPCHPHVADEVEEPTADAVEFE